MHSLPSADPDDPGFRRLRYVRYADDHLLGSTGPKAEAEEIKQRLAMFLRDELKLELSKEKTLITHARTQTARFLGYEITTRQNSTKITRGRRVVNGQIALRVPLDVIKAKCSPCLARGKPAKQTALMNSDDHTIVATFGTVYRGIIQYYLRAGDVHRLHRLRWVMETSMLKALAGKHRSTVSKMATKYKRTTFEIPNGPASLLRSESNGSTGNHWSHGSVEFHSNGNGRKHLPIVTRSEWTIRRRNSSRGSWRILARSAEARAMCKYTTILAMTESIRNGLPNHSRSSHWRAG
ncbi:group II intron-encoded protein LtrA [Embleya hyalina]|uniref:Group II intron-encoded protein LtrA n=2 Tax=Embleya hyalina TaxID=516124 RepID=A0A401Z4M9_9ACTN|nr:group II intron-encoded protein LtrA [Embleya hyalina]